MWSILTINKYKLHSLRSFVPKGPFILRLFSARLMTVTGKFRLPIRQQSNLTNRRSEFPSHSHESLTEKAQCKQAFKIAMTS